MPNTKVKTLGKSKTISFSKEEYTELDAIAKEKGLTVQELVDQTVEAFLKKMGIMPQTA